MKVLGCMKGSALVKTAQHKPTNKGESAIASNKSWVSVVLCVIVLVVLPSLYYGIAQYKFNGSYSIFDEITHMSYAWSASHGNIPMKGDSDASQALNDWSCSGQAGIELPKCNSGASAEKYPNLGQQYNYFHPPIYYFVTGIFARLISVVIPRISFFTAVRALSIVWMVAGCIALYFAIRAWKIERTYALSAVALVPYIPVFLNSGTAATNDAPALLCGASVVWVTAKIFVEQKKWFWQMILIILCCGFIKGTFVFPFLALAAVLVSYAVASFCRHQLDVARTSLIRGIVCGCASLVGVYAFQIVQKFRGDHTVASAVAGQNTDSPQGTPVGEFLNTVMSWTSLGLVKDSFREGMADSVGYPIWEAIIGIVIICSVIFLYFQHDKIQSHNMLCATTIFGLMMYPTLIQIREYMSSGELFRQITGRYGIVFLPLVLCCWALALQNRKSNVVAVVIPLIGSILCFAGVILLPQYGV